LAKLREEVLLESSNFSISISESSIEGDREEVSPECRKNAPFPFPYRRLDSADFTLDALRRRLL
jgi:hypothetical protein